MRSAALEFEKYEGLGNDFVVVAAADEDAIPAAVLRALCDRRFGVGADGVLLVLPPTSSGDGARAARMKVINADGSVPEMCGNGLRCVAVHVVRTMGLVRGDIVIETGVGPLACAVDDTGGQGIVTVDMGPVRFVEDRNIEVNGKRIALALADAGNPHAVTFVPATRELIDEIGPLLATHASFPRGTNVEFATLRGEAIDLVVWERGVGLTLACGTGACATVATACAKGLAPWDQAVDVHLPGGVLAITMRRSDGHAIMRGPARHVFSGTYRPR